MSSQMVAERRQVMINRIGTGLPKKPVAQVPCISKTLYETPPQSKFFPLQLFYHFVHLTFVYLSKFVAGQLVISFFDYYMVKLEKTLDYCVPQALSVADIDQHHRDTLTKTDRPMTWFFFIPALIWLRIFRFWLSVMSIVMGKGEVTAKQMQMKISAFRRYYRSVRHFAVKRYTPVEMLLKETRRAYSVFWRITYNIYESIVMTKPPIEHHSNMLNVEVMEQTDKNLIAANGSKHTKKNSLNEIDDDTTDDEDLSTKELLDKYENVKDSSADPDYVPSSSEDLSSDEVLTEADTEEEKTESQKQLNADESLENRSEALRVNGGYSSDTDLRKKSKKEKESIFTMNEEQMKEMEDQLVMKMMKHFKDNFNYSPLDKTSEDIFYSPIGSPPEKAYSSDPELNSNNIQQVQIDHQIPEVSSTQNNNKSPSAETNFPNNQVANQHD